MRVVAAGGVVLLAWAGLAAPGTGGSVDAKGLLLVANKADQTLGIVDPKEGRQVAALAESGQTGHEVIASPDGRYAYVPIYGDSGVGRPGSDGRSIDVFDLRTQKRVATIDLGRPERPHCPMFGPDGRLYVTTELTDTVTVIDPRTNAVVDHLPTGQREAHMVALSRDGRRAYTANVNVGTVSAIDVPAKKVLAVIPISKMTQRIAVSVDDRLVFTADQTAPRLAVIDTETLAVRQWVDLPGIAYGTAPTPDGKHLVMALIKTNQVGLLDLPSMKVTKVLDVPAAPQMPVVRPDGRFAYVSCDKSGVVAEIDLVDWKVARLIPAGRMADGLAWAAAD